MCGNIHNSTVEQSVCFCILHHGLQTSISFHPLTLQTVQTQMKCKTMLVSSGSALIAKITDETEIYLKKII